MTSSERWIWAWFAAGLLALTMLALAITTHRQEESDMETTVKTLQAEAVKKLAADDCAGVLDVCLSLEAKRGGPVIAHALRGAVFEKQGRFIEAEIQYLAAYNLEDHVAAGSAARVRRKAQVK